MPAFKKLLIANRGEIAVRIIRACRELGLGAVAVYSEADAHAMHVRLADEAVLIGGPLPGESYLRGERIIEAAHRTGAEAIHPGYGFLSENADFAQAVRAAGLIFVGPPPEAMRAMGSKTRARALMEAAGVPVVPGYHGAAAAGFAEMAATLGYPVLLKAAAGGGGRGMRVVRSPAELPAAVESAEREAAHAFGDGSIFLEKYVPRARHIEFQIFGDAHGHLVHLGERECSIQRRHQKVIEEAPSPLLQAHPELRADMSQAAVTAARAVGYQNAGTVEFIVDPDTLAYYFLEMNTRLQVEHPVTEWVTGVDLVKLQLDVARGEPLPFTQDEIAVRGHAIEARVYAEDPARDFQPAMGALLRVVEPLGPGLRVDSGFDTGDAIHPYYDAMLAKVIAHASSRTEALRRLDAALQRYVILGLTTNIPFLRAVLDHPAVQAGRATIQLIGEHFRDWRMPHPVPPVEAVAAAALADLLAASSSGLGGATAAAAPDPYSPWARGDGYRVGGG